MNRMSAHQALCAGLGGASLAFIPQTAFGLSLQGIPGQLLSSPVAPFVVGVLGGAAVAGGVYGIVVKAAELADGPRAEKAQRPAVASGAVAAPVAASIYKPRHMSPQDFEKSGVIRVIPAKSYEKNEAKTAKPQQKHFKSYIIERFGEAMMEGVPVIQRADGSVGDVGTSWWERGVGEKTIISSSGFSNERSVDEGIHDRDWIALQNITHRVAQIDEGLYPEKRTSEDLDKSDMWTTALEAIDEQLGETGNQGRPMPAFIDTIGGSDTLDEPDNLEKNTGFIPFKVPAGHPEVVDTDSYINHLVSDEFSRSTSASARSSSRHFMRVIEGGTHNLKAKENTNVGTRTGKHFYVGKHFASMPIAAEA